MTLTAQKYDYPETIGDDCEWTEQGKQLIKQFPDLLGKLALRDLMVPVKRRIRHAGMFGLIALHNESYPTTMESSGYVAPDNADILTTFRLWGMPYLDTRQAIGLVRNRQPYDDWEKGKNRWLIAIAGAGVDHQGNTVITQLHDVTSVRKKDSEYRYLRTGLHHGFLWRDTLVQA